MTKKSVVKLSPFPFKGNQTILIIFSAVLLISLVAIIQAVRKTQELRRGAAGTGVVRVALSPTSRTLNYGETIGVNFTLNSTQSGLAVRVAGADVQFVWPAGSGITRIDQVFELTNFTCNSAFPSPATGIGIDATNPNLVHMSCFVPATGTPVPLPLSSPVNFGSFNLKVKDATTFNGAVTLNFVRTRVPHKDTDIDLSDSGTPAVYQIGPLPTLTPTPALKAFEVQVWEDLGGGNWDMWMTNGMTCPGYTRNGNMTITANSSTADITWQCAYGLQTGSVFHAGDRYPWAGGNRSLGRYSFGFVPPAGYVVTAWKAYSETCPAGGGWTNCKHNPEYRDYTGATSTTAPVLLDKNYVVEFIIRQALTPTPTPTVRPTVTPTTRPTVTPTSRPTTTPTPTIKPCSACDFTGDGQICQNDIDLFTPCYGQPATGACARFDMNGDGVINILDWSRCASCINCGTTPTPTRIPTVGPTVTPTRTPTITPTPTVAPQCRSLSIAGDSEGDDRIWETGRSTGSFKFEYDAYSVSDRFQIFYEGNLILDTGPQQFRKVHQVRYGRTGGSTQLRIKVLPNSDCPTSKWKYWLDCPTGEDLPPSEVVPTVMPGSCDFTGGTIEYQGWTERQAPFTISSTGWETIQFKPVDLKNAAGRAGVVTENRRLAGIRLFVGSQSQRGEIELKVTDQAGNEITETVVREVAPNLTNMPLTFGFRRETVINPNQTYNVLFRSRTPAIPIAVYYKPTTGLPHEFAYAVHLKECRSSGPYPTGEPCHDPCPRGDLGNLNCDQYGHIDETDVNILLVNWAPYGPVNPPLPGHHTSDLNHDGKVDEIDLAILLTYWCTAPICY